MKDTKNKNGLYKILLIISIILITIGIIFAIIAKIKGNSKSNDNIMSTNSFFLKNKEGKYALFNDSGKQLTKFIFTDVEEFYDHTSLVENEDKKRAIIKDNGKYLIEFGKYDSIYSDGSLYKLVNYKSDNKYKYINAQGKEFLKTNSREYDISSPEYNMYLYLLINDTETKILDYKGNQLDVLPVAGGMLDRNGSLSADASMTKDRLYISLTYGKRIYIYNLKTKKKLADVDYSYGVLMETDETGKRVIVSDSKNNYVYQEGKQILQIPKTSDCKELYFLGNGYICYNRGSSSSKTIYDKNGNVKVNNVYSYIDMNNYVIRDQNNKSEFKFYSNGKLKNTVSLNEIENQYDVNQIYTVKNYNYKVRYYNKEGKEINETIYSKNSGDFNPAGYCLVNYTENKYYVIDKNGKKVSEVYDKASKMDYIDYYEATKNNIKYLLNEQGKLIAKGYIKVNYKNSDNLLDKIFITYENKTEIYSISKNKVIATINEANLNFEDNYAYKTSGGTTTYYSYKTGKSFYSI